MFRASRLRGGPGEPQTDWRDNVSIVGILIVVILILLVIYLFQRVR
jgi:hypothetical protein